MCDFFTTKLLLLALAILLIQLPQIALAGGGPIQSIATFVGALIAALILASALKLLYLGLRFSARKARSVTT